MAELEEYCGRDYVKHFASKWNSKMVISLNKLLVLATYFIFVGWLYHGLIFFVKLSKVSIQNSKS
jgi:hypothetical protein